MIFNRNGSKSTTSFYIKLVLTKGCTLDATNKLRIEDYKKLIDEHRNKIKDLEKEIKESQGKEELIKELNQQISERNTKIQDLEKEIKEAQAIDNRAIELDKLYRDKLKVLKSKHKNWEELMEDAEKNRNILERVEYLTRGLVNKLDGGVYFYSLKTKYPEDWFKLANLVIEHHIKPWYKGNKKSRYGDYIDPEKYVAAIKKYKEEEGN